MPRHQAEPRWIDAYQVCSNRQTPFSPSVYLGIGAADCRATRQSLARWTPARCAPLQACWNLTALLLCTLGHCLVAQISRRAHSGVHLLTFSKKGCQHGRLAFHAFMHATCTQELDIQILLRRSPVSSWRCGWAARTMRRRPRRATAAAAAQAQRMRRGARPGRRRCCRLPAAPSRRGRSRSTWTPQSSRWDGAV
jgi:hypothetical protein